MKQFTVTERNDNEGEVWGYILYIDSDKEAIIKDRFDKKIESDIEFCESHWSLEETKYTDEQVELINKHCDNSYLPRLGYYLLSSKVTNLMLNPDEVENLSFEDIFYKARFLEKYKNE
jgi:hypothetical protein